MKLTGKTALITGGASGIGKAITQRFQSEGANTIVFDLREPDFQTTFLQVDVSKESEIIKAFQTINNLDIVVNNAGIYFQSSVEETTEDQLEKILSVNIKSTFLISKHALPLIKKSHGTIINISSCLGLVPEPEAPAYCATKAAIIMLTKTMSQTYAKDRVRINSIAPGPIDTPLLQKYFSSQEQKEEYLRNKPMGKIGTPEDVANVALFLASDEASFINGGIYTIDGGEAASSIYSK
ncbi:MAG: SDR family oxidoreductase [bacterium]|nr:SDR family oxidoreductase [bacterium]